MSHAIIVAGAESSGTRLATRLLITAGFHGQHSHNQLLDGYTTTKKLSAHVASHSIALATLRRSLPHSGNWPSLTGLYSLYASVFTSVSFLITLRDPSTLSVSQVARSHTSRYSSAIANADRANALIFAALAATSAPYSILHFSALCLHPHPTIHAALTHLSIPLSPQLLDTLVAIIDPTVEEKRAAQYQY